MPLSASGDLKVVISHDLKGLGETDGPPIHHHWKTPSLWPKFLPWFGVLGLIALPRNRSARNWLILLPLGFVAWIANAEPGVSEAGLSSEASFLAPLLTPLALGIAAVFVAAPYLSHRFRILNFFKMLAMAAGVAAFAYLVSSGVGSGAESLARLITLGLCSLVMILSLWLAGLICRRTYRPWRLTLGYLVFVALLVILVSAPFVVVPILLGSGPALSDVVKPLAFFAAILAVIGLPFLLLGLLHSFHRERLKALLLLVPAIVPPLPPPVTTAGQGTPAPAVEVAQK